MTPDWDCEAYGPEAREVGALCFFERECLSQEECGSKMAAERQRVFQRISELSATGDPTWTYLEGKFNRPDQLLGGEEP